MKKDMSDTQTAHEEETAKLQQVINELESDIESAHNDNKCDQDRFKDEANGLKVGTLIDSWKCFNSLRYRTKFTEKSCKILLERFPTHTSF